MCAGQEQGALLGDEIKLISPDILNAETIRRCSKMPAELSGAAFQRFMAQLFRQWPSQPGLPRPPDTFPGAPSHLLQGWLAAHLTFGHAGGGKPQHIADFAHR